MFNNLDLGARYRSRRILPSYGIGSVRTESDNKLSLLEERPDDNKGYFTAKGGHPFF